MENNLENPYDLDVPRLYEPYDYVGDNGMVENSTWYGDIIDRERLALGNVFSVRTSVSKVRQAEAAVRMAFKSLHVAENGE